MEEITDTQLEARVYSEIHIKGTGYKNSMSVNCWPMVMAGKNTSRAGLPYLISENRVLEKGDILVLELGVGVDGFWSDLTRTIVVGKADARQMGIFEIIQEAQKAAMDRIKHGIPEREVNQAARNIVKSHGFEKYFHHHTGRGIVFKYH